MNRHDHRDRDHDRYRHRSERPRPIKKGGWGPLRILTVLGVAGVAMMLLISTGRHAESVITPPGPVKIAKLSPRNLQDAAELNGFDGGAKAGQAALAKSDAVKPEPPQGGTVFIVGEVSDAAATPAKADPLHPQSAIRIVGIRSEKAYVNRADAIADAQRVARQRLAEVLQSLDPPILVLPSDAQIASDYIAPNSAKDVPPSQEIKDAWSASHLEANRQWATVDIEVSESQLRTLRAKQRLIDLGWILGGVFAVVGAGYGALKLDALAKNYFVKPAVPAAA